MPCRAAVLPALLAWRGARELVRTPELGSVQPPAAPRSLSASRSLILQPWTCVPRFFLLKVTDFISG